MSNPIVGVVDLVKKINASNTIEVGIDAPRTPLNNKRVWYWDGTRRRWHQRMNQNGYGRHCEIVLSAHRIANPQWTPLVNDAPEWMRHGFSLYSALNGICQVHEVFPTASYNLLSGVCDVRLKVDFSACKPGPKDMLDAWVSAVTVREFVAGCGGEVGDGDGLGTIVLPRPLPKPIAEVLVWPIPCETFKNKAL